MPQNFVLDTLETAVVAHPFDIEHGVETSGLIDGGDLPTPHPNSIWNHAYYGVAPSVFRGLMEKVEASIHPDLSRFAFVDLGSGKGRALMLALGYPFESVLGIELSPDLHRVAEANLARCSPPGREIRCLEGDATTLELPPSPLLVFLYNPFLPPVLRACLANLRGSVAERPRDLILAYVVPAHEAVVDEAGFLAKVWEGRIELSPEDAAADRFGRQSEAAAIYRCVAKGRDGPRRQEDR